MFYNLKRSIHQYVVTVSHGSLKKKKNLAHLELNNKSLKLELPSTSLQTVRSGTLIFTASPQLRLTTLISQCLNSLVFGL